MDTLKANVLKKAIESGSNKLFNNKDKIDALNVFPVPDGDTGSNMASTLQKAFKEIENQNYKKVKDLIENLSKNMLLSARGNSGVILSQIFKGFSNAWNKLESLSPKDIVRGFKLAYKTAYESVLKPVEGTILTIIRETYEELSKLKITSNTTINKIFDVVVKAANKSLKNTPNLLPILKEVGVVDSGGNGLVLIFEGMKSALEDKFIQIDMESTKPFSTVNNVEVYSGEFGYCTELIIKINNLEKFSKNKFVSQLEKIGDSMVVVNDKEILKLHIHTVTPGKVLNIGQKIGEFLTVKIENMTEQANHTKSNVIDNHNTNKPEIMKKNAIISCNSGNGFIKIMKELECDYIIEGGQSNNPSAQDIIEAIDNVNAENTLILPNNSNIILAAQQASKIRSNKNIHIIPTKNQVEGITAIMNYSSELDMENNLKEIEQSLKNLIVGEITQSIKDTKIDGIKIKKDSYLMIMQHKIIDTKKDLMSAAKTLIDKMIKSKKRPELLVIYYGNNISQLETEELENYVLNKYDVEVQIQNGDQYIYDLIFGLE